MKELGIREEEREAVARTPEKHRSLKRAPGREVIKSKKVWRTAVYGGLNLYIV